MIGYIKGIVTDSFENKIIIENNDIGYEVSVTDSSPLHLKVGMNEKVTVYTTMIVREDDISLYGFVDRYSLLMFLKLITVSGVGAKAALSMLSVLSPEEVSKAIVFEDVNTITRAQGIGKKIAQRVVLELKDKLSDISGLSSSGNSFANISDTGVINSEDPKTEALYALTALGYSKSEAAAVLKSIEGEELTSEEYIKMALKKL